MCNTILCGSLDLYELDSHKDGCFHWLEGSKRILFHDSKIDVEFKQNCIRAQFVFYFFLTMHKACRIETINSCIKSSLSLSWVAVTDYDVCEWVRWLSLLQTQTYTSKHGFSVVFLMQSSFFIQSHCIPLKNI